MNLSSWKKNEHFLLTENAGGKRGHQPLGTGKSDEKREREKDRQADNQRDIEKEREREGGRAFYKENIVNVHRRCF